jgi:hypothetical protein
MRTTVLGPETANDTGEMTPEKMIKQAAAITARQHDDKLKQTKL